VIPANEHGVSILNERSTFGQPGTGRDVDFVAIATMAAAAAMNIIESRKYGNGVMYGR
jgi:hypothetical protein